MYLLLGLVFKEEASCNLINLSERNFKFLVDLPDRQLRPKFWLKDKRKSGMSDEMRDNRSLPWS
jgi:hypothetical protein